MAFEEHETPIGTFAFGNVVGAPQPDLSDNLCWLCGFRVENEQLDTLLTNIDAAINEYKEKNPSFPADVEKLKLPFGPAKLAQVGSLSRPC